MVFRTDQGRTHGTPAVSPWNGQSDNRSTEADALVFIIGAGRSGTTLLSDLLGKIPNFARLAEKRYVWMYGAYWRSHDLRGAADATPRVRQFIHQFFERARKRANATYLVEKTPSNCFRVPFLTALYPRARFIHIVRDGRSVAFSSVRAFMGEKYVTDDDRRQGRRTLMQRGLYLLQRWPEIPRRFQEGDLPPSGWLPYAWRKGLEFLQIIGSRKPTLWGAKYPGIYADREAYSPLELAGRQWNESVTRAVADLAGYVPLERQLTIRYEDLIARPVETLSDVIDFLGTSVDAATLESMAAEVRGDGDETWKGGLDAHEYSSLLPHVAGTLSLLGYADSKELNWVPAPKQR